MFAGLEPTEMRFVYGDLTRRRPILFAGPIIARGCDVGRALVLEEYEQGRELRLDLDSADVPWLVERSGKLRLEARVIAEVRLADDFAALGRGPACDEVTHISQRIEVGSGRVTVNGKEVWASYEIDEPLRAVVVPIVIGPAPPPRIEDRIGYAEPMILVSGGRYRGKTVKPFWIDRFEVSHRAFRACVQAQQCEPDDPDGDDGDDDDADDGLPMIGANWFDARLFCEWAGKRLPTLREWQWVARGREEGRRFPWGDELPSCERVNAMDPSADYGEPCSESLDFARPGEHPLGASRDGVEDLAGNVNEFVAEAGVWAGSGIEQYLIDWDLGHFAPTLHGDDGLVFGGIRCAADSPPAEVLAISQPSAEVLADLKLAVHVDPGQRTRKDAAARCAKLVIGKRKHWRVPSPTILAQIASRIDLASIPYWSTAPDKSTKYARALCIHDA